MKATDIREQFLSFFESKSHTRVPSSVLVPAGDPTLLFTNAGMVQFKDVFLGREKAGCARATSSQRCVRAGGKHNDLENVGYTFRHHTFFEMLGNFSFGDYFKQAAVAYAWEFVARNLELPLEKLWVTVFEEDNETEKIWLQETDIPPQRCVRVGAADNFWSMGDIGPCGPCTEIFYDHGNALQGTPPGSSGDEGDRFVEIWNLVFMQYERDEDGAMTKLPKPSVDTGMGLERIAAVMQGVNSNYDTDLFQGLIRRAADLFSCNDLSQASLRVIADHIRACSFLIVDGVLPSNEDRGYVLRRIIRRAVRHGRKLGGRGVFFHKLVNPLVEIMGDAYPELTRSESRVSAVLQQEEERFEKTLDTGLGILEENLAALPDDQIPGRLIFKLYDTYGFPVDLTGDIAREKGLRLDMEGFEVLMEQQKTRARRAGVFSAADESDYIRADTESAFTGYDKVSDESAVSRLFVQAQEVERIEANEEAIVILENTPFYAEAGGQIGDTGLLIHNSSVFEVKDTQKQGGLHKHIGILKSGALAVGDVVQAQVDHQRRQRIVLNHSATHLLHAALRQVLGEQVCQKGSLVAEHRLRFDFSCDQPVPQQQLEEIEDLVNSQIRGNVAAQAEVMPKDDAFKKGAVALFGEKYGDQVRVLTMGDFSVEFCGGTHVGRTGDIGLFKIIAETGIAAGIRRIEAVTGDEALRHIKQESYRLDELARLLKAGRHEISQKVTQLIEKNRGLEKRLEKFRMQLNSETSRKLASRAVDVNGIKVLATRIDGIDRKSLRNVVDEMKNRLGSAAIVLGVADHGKVQLVAGVTEDFTERVQAGKLVNMVAQQVGGKGGGKRADMAEAGGGDPAGLDKALASVPEWIRSKL